MSNTQSSMKCRNCGHKFHPDMQSMEGWLCPNYRTQHPNLRQHYRAIAYLCGFGCFVTLIVLLAVILSVVVPLSLSCILNMSPVIVFALVFPYLFWVDGHARRLSA